MRNSQAIRKALQIHMISRGYSQAQLAQRMGVHESTVSRCLNGAARSFSGAMARSVAKELDISVAQLFDMSERESPPA